MPTALRGYGFASRQSDHAHAKPWAGHPASRGTPMSARSNCTIGFDPVAHPRSSQVKPAFSAFHLLLACALPFAAAALLPAQDQDAPAPPAVLDIILPPGATA